MGLPEILVSEEFEARASGRMRLLVRCVGADAIAQALTTGENCTPLQRDERGALLRFPWAEGRDGLVRICHRGGFVARLLGDRYLFVNRPGREFMAHWWAEHRGVAVPRLLGVRWERHGPWFRGALATEWLPGPDLLAWLRGHETEEHRSERARMMQEVGVLVRDMHWRGVWHADLQVKNVVIADGHPRLIDLDRAAIGGMPGVVQCSRNLLRFRRSLEKNNLPDVCFLRFAAGYGSAGGAGIPAWLDKIYQWKGKLSPSGRGKKAGL